MVVGYSTVYAQHKKWLIFSKYYICPRRVAMEDLKMVVNKCTSEGGNIIIYIDTNKAIRRGLLGGRIKRIGTRTFLEEKHSLLREINNWFCPGTATN